MDERLSRQPSWAAVSAAKAIHAADFRAWQNDLVSTAAPQWVELYKSYCRTQNLINNIKPACALVANWDGIVSADSAAACIYHVVLQTLIDQLISEAASKDDCRQF